ncbi:unnamed protein product, partial [Meganyctiphanes norvegica]
MRGEQDLGCGHDESRNPSTLSWCSGKKNCITHKAGTQWESTSSNIIIDGAETTDHAVDVDKDRKTEGSALSGDSPGFSRTGVQLSLSPAVGSPDLSPSPSTSRPMSRGSFCVLDCRYCRYVCEGRIAHDRVSPLWTPTPKTSFLLSPRVSPS